MFNQINANKGLVHYGFPSIEQIANTIDKVNRYATYIGDDATGDPIYNPELPKPVLKFIGTTKIHGTNAGIVIDFQNEVIYFESKDVVLIPSVNGQPAQDNHGFAGYMSSIQEDIIELIISQIDITSIDWTDKVFVLYGEWAGGSIQGGVGVSKLEKMFVILKAAIRPRINTESRNIKWIPFQELKEYKISEKRIFNIYDFKTWDLEIDFNNHSEVINTIYEAVKEVEDSCPVSKELGNEGTGEGIVYECITEPYNTSNFWFKSKGLKHTKHPKTKIEKPVDDEKVARMMDIADKITPEWRLEQMFNDVFKINEGGIVSRTKIGDYIKAVYEDIDKEEQLTLKEHGVTTKEINGYVGKIVRDYFFIMEKDFLENKLTSKI